jgi:hypothetical protein
MLAPGIAPVCCSRPLVTCLVVLVFAVTPAPASGKREPCPVTHRPDVPIMVGSTIRLEVEPGVPGDLVPDAIAQWSACSGYGESFPRFVLEGEGDATVGVRLETRVPGAAHCGYYGRREIVLFTEVRTHNGIVLPCPHLDKYLAHELGHLLGLADQGEDRRCRAHIMAPIFVESLGPRGRERRQVQEEECLGAARRWLTWEELAALGAVEVEMLRAQAGLPVGSSPRAGIPRSGRGSRGRLAAPPRPHLESQRRHRAGVELARRLLASAQALAHLAEAQLFEPAQ